VAIKCLRRIRFVVYRQKSDHRVLTSSAGSRLD
jgi:hypothetical protein